jgi:hypothetical protein
MYTGVPEPPKVAAVAVTPQVIGSSPFAASVDDDNNNDSKESSPPLPREGAPAVVAVAVSAVAPASASSAEKKKDIGRSSSRSPSLSARASPSVGGVAGNGAAIPAFDLHNNDNRAPVGPPVFIAIGPSSDATPRHVPIYYDDDPNDFHGGNARQQRIARAAARGGIAGRGGRRQRSAVPAHVAAVAHAAQFANPLSSTAIYTPKATFISRPTTPPAATHPRPVTPPIAAASTPSPAKAASSSSSSSLPANLVSAVAANVVAAQREAVRPWSCSRCTLENGGLADTCMVCDAPRPRAGASTPSVSVTPTPTTVAPASVRSSSPVATARPATPPSSSVSSPPPVAVAVAVAIPIAKRSSIASPLGSEDGLWHEDADEPGLVIVDQKDKNPLGDDSEDDDPEAWDGMVHDQVGPHA